MTTAAAQSAAVDHSTLVPILVAAHRLRISREVAMGRLLRGELTGHRVGGRWYVELGALERAIEAQGATI
jgi:hypothetical protein